MRESKAGGRYEFRNEAEKETGRGRVVSGIFSQSVSDIENSRLLTDSRIPHRERSERCGMSACTAAGASGIERRSDVFCAFFLAQKTSEA